MDTINKICFILIPLCRQYYNCFRKGLWLNIEPEVHHVAILHHIFLAFYAQPSIFAAGSLAFIQHEVGIGDHFRFDKAFFKISMYHAGSLRCFPSCMYGPCPHLLHTCRKVGGEVQQLIGGPYQPVQAGLHEAIFRKKTILCLLRFLIQISGLQWNYS